jgi:heme-degrading monooxygenase HmoA
MWARVSTFQGEPGRADENIQIMMDRALPAARQLAGFRGVLGLADRASGKSVAVTLWESEEAMRDSETAADRIREDSAQAGGEQIVSVERYEVTLDERQ